jgi:hypothetical protein
MPENYVCAVFLTDCSSMCYTSLSFFSLSLSLKLEAKVDGCQVISLTLLLLALIKTNLQNLLAACYLLSSSLASSWSLYHADFSAVEGD